MFAGSIEPTTRAGQWTSSTGRTARFATSAPRRVRPAVIDRPPADEHVAPTTGWPAGIGRTGGCPRGGYTAGAETPVTRGPPAARSTREGTGRPPAIATRTASGFVEDVVGGGGPSRHTHRPRSARPAASSPPTIGACYGAHRRGAGSWRGPRRPPLLRSRPPNPPHIYTWMVAPASPLPVNSRIAGRIPRQEGHRSRLPAAGAGMTRRSRRSGPAPGRSAPTGPDRGPPG
jgi:hypothetical protein